jgi:Leucine-rich repeat (LRR) protein
MVTKASTQGALDAVLRRGLVSLSAELDPKELARKKTLEYPRSSQSAIKSLAGIEVCKGLTRLKLPGHAITDLSPLRALTKLEHLHLYNNPELCDVTPLAELRALQVLYLSQTRVSDLSGLCGHPALTYLSVSETPITDITPLVELPKLETVILRDCKQLVIAAGDPNYVAVTRLIDRGVDVYVQGNPDVDAYKVARGVAPS